MAGARLDDIDRQILAELQADGRMTNVELARRVGISAPPCLRRVRTLEEQGYIRRYVALADPDRLGLGLLGLSRTPVREAAIRLAEEGLVSIRPRHGITVVDLTLVDFRDILDVFSALEVRAVALAAQQVILGDARRLGCELIVIGHRHLGRLERLLDPSVGDRVIREAPCPVLVEVREGDAQGS